jgi:hypothetical protein
MHVFTATNTISPAADAPQPKNDRPAPLAHSDRMEIYSQQHIAEFLVNNAVTPEDYASAIEEVRRLGIDPASIPHEKPAGI